MEQNILKKNLDQLLDITYRAKAFIAEKQKNHGILDIRTDIISRTSQILENLNRVYPQKPTIAIFGPIQTGKSSLVAGLVQPYLKKLSLNFQGTVLNYLRQVNPPGGGATTALISRFSVERSPISPDPACPVCLKLFSEVDIIKLLSKAYFCPNHELPSLDLNALSVVLKKLETLNLSPAYATTDTELIDLRDYINLISERFPLGRELNAHFWPKAISLAQRLNLPERVELFSFLWGNIPELSILYRKMGDALELLNYPDLAFTEIKALFDEDAAKNYGEGRENSILRVPILENLLNESTDTLKIIGNSRKSVFIERAILSALTLEIHCKVNESPGEFLEKADLLDFPGLDSRYNYRPRDLANFLKDPRNLQKFFSGAKCAYLFEKYTQKKEIDILLVCLRDGNIECPDLPEMIENWVERAHGETPTERAGKEVCLFLVLTFFNHLLFQDPASQTNLHKIWDNRINSNLREPFKNNTWPDEFSRIGEVIQRFQNSFWHLDIPRSDKFLIPQEIDGDNSVYISKGIRPEMLKWIEELKASYLDNDFINFYFKDPLEAWKGVLESPDGGIGYLTSKLTVLLRSDFRFKNFLEQLFNLAQNLNGIITADFSLNETSEEKAFRRAVREELSKILFELQKQLETPNS
ncbi:MAG: putative virulence factor [Deltaproteobacteria bacterium]|jgi:hypothetical protein|nr:putative virulence factor [Deltaproteobacteria bacterium]